MALRGGRCELANRALLQPIHVDGGRVTGFGEEPGACATELGADDVDLSGFFVMPGLINAHDHLQFALHPRLADPPYRNYVDWGNDIHAKFPDVFSQYRAVPKDVRLWWGGLRNLLCGVTTVCHHDPLWPELKRQDFPVRVVRNYGWAHSVALGQDLGHAFAATPPGSAFMIHAGEGIDEQARQEIFTLDRLGLLGARTVLIHGLAIDEQSLGLMKSRGTSLIVCPSSNEFLFHRLPDAATISRVENVALGSDSPLTSEGDLLDEVRFAVQRCGISSQTVYRMVTTTPARILGLTNGEGSIQVSSYADLVGIRDSGQSGVNALPVMSVADIEFVMVAGRVNLASGRVFDALPSSQRRRLEPLWIDGMVRWLRAPVKELLRRAEAVLGAGNVRLGGRTIRIPAQCEAMHVC